MSGFKTELIIMLICIVGLCGCYAGSRTTMKPDGTVIVDHYGTMKSIGMTDGELYIEHDPNNYSIYWLVVGGYRSKVDPNAIKALGGAIGEAGKVVVGI